MFPYGGWSQPVEATQALNLSGSPGVTERLFKPIDEPGFHHTGARAVYTSRSRKKSFDEADEHGCGCGGRFQLFRTILDPCKGRPSAFLNVSAVRARGNEQR
jgi:hypothetical protein